MRSAVSDAASSLLDFVPSLGTRGVFAFGEGVAIPTRLRFSQLPEERLPRSEAVSSDTDFGKAVDQEFIDVVVDRWSATLRSVRTEAATEGPAPAQPAGPSRLDPNREREEVLRFFQKVTGLRMNHNFIRPGGVAADLPAGWRDDVLRLLDMIPPRLDEYDVLMTGQPIWRERLQGVGVITAQEAIALAATGPILRSTGTAWDLRRRHALPALPGRRVRCDRRLVR